MLGGLQDSSVCGNNEAEILLSNQYGYSCSVLVVKVVCYTSKIYICVLFLMHGNVTSCILNAPFLLFAGSSTHTSSSLTVREGGEWRS